LADQEPLAHDGKISFFVKSEMPEKFGRDAKIEVASVDETFHAILSVSDGNLVLQDAETVLATLEPLKSFGLSAFGPLRFRAISEEGRRGDWVPLATLVRLPQLKEIRCPDSPDKQCKLSGTNLFLLEAVASDPQFAHTAPVPGDSRNRHYECRVNGTLSRRREAARRSGDSEYGGASSLAGRSLAGRVGFKSSATDHYCD
jgi:hypothetical protein